MSLAGRLRDLGVAEVLQLLALSRKSGRLELHAPLEGLAAMVCFDHGVINDAQQWQVMGNGSGPTSAEQRHTKQVAACVAELLLWRDGEFQFLPAEGAVVSTGVRLAVESMLVEAAVNGEVWDRIRDRVPHQRVIPAFVNAEPESLPLLHLSPQEWEVLTRVDGVRDLQALAAVLGRPPVDVAECVHRLIGEGVLVLRESAIVAARHPTPPSGVPGRSTEALAVAVTPVTPPITPSSTDLWIPSGDDDLATPEFEDVHDDTLFDPFSGGVFADDGLPRRRTSPNGERSVANPLTRATTPESLMPFASAFASAFASSFASSVASSVTETSVLQGNVSSFAPESDATALCQHGDEAARRGDLASALSFWSAALRSEVLPANTDRIREAISLAARLHALLHPAAERP